mmetsp:Transcript_49/g.93  ORF Transcript_49/g.93 Transcript_49/m.93 type:complete len:127 (+) Transcript_49:287-667(+)
MEINPRSPEGILDMMGPRTLEGGYSPSQVMSSEAMDREVKGAEGMEAVVEIAARGMGAKAAETARTAERMIKESLDIVIDTILVSVSNDFITVCKRWEVLTCWRRQSRWMDQLHATKEERTRIFSH